MEKKYLTNLEKEKLGIEYIKKIYKEKKGIELIPPSKKQYGFDLKTQDEKEFIELKVVTSGTSTARTFYVTNCEYEKAQECIKNGKTYNFIAVYNVELDLPYYRTFPAQYIISKMKPTMQRKFYIEAEEIEKFKDL